MSGILSLEMVKSVAEHLGVATIKDDVALVVAQDVEYRLREVIQEARKFMRHAKRTRLHVDDINAALRVRNVERLYGYGSSAPLYFKAVPNASTPLFYVEDDEVDFDDIISAPLPKAPLETTFTAHWLAVEGVQPAIPQNPAPIDTRIETLSQKLRAESHHEFLEKKVDVKPLVKHVLSKELQLYYEKIVQALLSNENEIRDAALESIGEDNGLQQLLPYFINFITDQVAKNIKQLRIMQSMLLTIRAILDNPNFFVEPYLHQLMPPILTCLVSKKICENPQDDHWSVRQFAGRLISTICTKYGQTYSTLYSRVTRTLLRAFLDPQRALTTHYGAIIGLSYLGADVIKTLIIPNLKAYVDLIRPELTGPEKQNTIKRLEAEKAYRALLSGAVVYLVSELKKPGAPASLESIEHSPLLFSVFGEQLRVELAKNQQRLP